MSGEKEASVKAQLAELVRMKRLLANCEDVVGTEGKKLTISSLESNFTPLKKEALELLPYFTSCLNRYELAKVSKLLIAVLKSEITHETMQVHVFAVDALSTLPINWVERNISFLYAEVKVPPNAEGRVQLVKSYINLYRRTLESFAGSMQNDKMVVTSAMGNWGSIASLALSDSNIISISAFSAIKKLFLARHVNDTLQNVISHVSITLRKSLEQLLRRIQMLPPAARYIPLRVISQLPEKRGIAVDSRDFGLILDALSQYSLSFDPCLVHESFRGVCDLYQYYRAKLRESSGNRDFSKNQITKALTEATIELVNLLRRNDIRESNCAALVVEEAVQHIDCIRKEKLLGLGTSLVRICTMDMPLKSGIYSLYALWMQLIPYSVEKLLQTYKIGRALPQKEHYATEFSPLLQNVPLFQILYNSRISEIWERMDTQKRTINARIVFISLMTALEEFVSQIDKDKDATTIKYAGDVMVLVMTAEILMKSSAVLFTFFDNYTNLLNRTLILCDKYGNDIPRVVHVLQRLLNKLFVILDKRKMPEAVTLKLLLMISQHLQTDDILKFKTIVDHLVDFVLQGESKFQYIAIHALNLLYIRYPPLRESLDIQSRRFLMFRRKTKLPFPQHVSEAISTFSEMSMIISGGQDEQLAEITSADYSGNLFDDVFPSHDRELIDATLYAKEKHVEVKKESGKGRYSGDGVYSLARNIEMSASSDPIKIFSDVKLSFTDRTLEMVSTVVNLTQEKMFQFTFYASCNGGAFQTDTSAISVHILAPKETLRFKNKFELISFSSIVFTVFITFRDTKGNDYRISSPEYALPLKYLLVPLAMQVEESDSCSSIWNSLPAIYVVSVFGHLVANAEALSVFSSPKESKSGSGSSGFVDFDYFNPYSVKTFDDEGERSGRTVYILFGSRTVWNEQLLLALTARQLREVDSSDVVNSGAPGESTKEENPSAEHQIWVGQVEFRSSPAVLSAVIERLDDFISSLNLALPNALQDDFTDCQWSWRLHLPQPRVGEYSELDTGIELKNL